MRKLEFRFWDIKGQRWEEKFGIYADGVIGDFSECFHNSAGENGEYYIAQQFTGLSDTEGNKVFEGDIIEMLNLQLSDWPLLVVEFEDARFIGKYQDNMFMFLGGKTEFKVVGNIFQNTELLLNQ